MPMLGVHKAGNRIPPAVALFAKTRDKSRQQAAVAGGVIHPSYNKGNQEIEKIFVRDNYSIGLIIVLRKHEAFGRR